VPIGRGDRPRPVTGFLDLPARSPQPREEGMTHVLNLETLRLGVRSDTAGAGTA